MTDTIFERLLAYAVALNNRRKQYREAESTVVSEMQNRGIRSAVVADYELSLVKGSAVRCRSCNADIESEYKADYLRIKKISRRESAA